MGVRLGLFFRSTHNSPQLCPDKRHCFRQRTALESNASNGVKRATLEWCLRRTGAGWAAPVIHKLLTIRIPPKTTVRSCRALNSKGLTVQQLLCISATIYRARLLTDPICRCNLRFHPLLKVEAAGAVALPIGMVLRSGEFQSDVSQDRKSRIHQIAKSSNLRRTPWTVRGERPYEKNH